MTPKAPPARLTLGILISFFCLYSFQNFTHEAFWFQEPIDNNSNAIARVDNKTTNAMFFLNTGGLLQSASPTSFVVNTSRNLHEHDRDHKPCYQIQTERLVEFIRIILECVHNTRSRNKYSGIGHPERAIRRKGLGNQINTPRSKVKRIQCPYQLLQRYFRLEFPTYQPEAERDHQQRLTCQ